MLAIARLCGVVCPRQRKLLEKVRTRRRRRVCGCRSVHLDAYKGFIKTGAQVLGAIEDHITAVRPNPADHH